MLRTSAAGLVWASRVEAATTCPVHPFRCADSRASGQGGDRRSSTTAVRDDLSTLRGVAGVAGGNSPGGGSPGGWGEGISLRPPRGGGGPSPVNLPPAGVAPLASPS